MEVVDSKKQKLDPPAIILKSAKMQDTQGLNNTQLLGAVGAQMSLPNSSTVQVGNTVFLTFFGKTPETNKKAVGRAFNVDTGKNFINNGFQFFQSLQRQGVTHYSTQFKGHVFLNAFKIFQRRAAKQDTKIYIGKTQDEQYNVYILFGKEPLVLGKNK